MAWIDHNAYVFPSVSTAMHTTYTHTAKTMLEKMAHDSLNAQIDRLQRNPQNHKIIDRRKWDDDEKCLEYVLVCERCNAMRRGRIWPGQVDERKPTHKPMTRNCR